MTSITRYISSVYLNLRYFMKLAVCLRILELKSRTVENYGLDLTLSGLSVTDSVET